MPKTPTYLQNATKGNNLTMSQQQSSTTITICELRRKVDKWDKRLHQQRNDLPFNPKGTCLAQTRLNTYRKQLLLVLPAAHSLQSRATFETGELTNPTHATNTYRGPKTPEAVLTSKKKRARKSSNDPAGAQLWLKRFILHRLWAKKQTQERTDGVLNKMRHCRNYLGLEWVLMDIENDEEPGEEWVGQKRRVKVPKCGW